MAVGENVFPALPPIDGCKLSTAAAGIRYADRTDMALLELCSEASLAGCFTQNSFQAAPVTVAKAHLAKSSAASATGGEQTDVGARYLVINSGNANACTGSLGEQDARETCAAIGGLAEVNPANVLPFSTGVIGERLNMKALVGALPALYETLRPDAWRDAAEAITTTDTFPKGTTRSIEVDGQRVTINGIAKGSGMIRPDMATMLAYIVTDAAVDQSFLSELCRQATNKSLNRITVDGDTSTNDAVMLAATGRAGNTLIHSLDQPGASEFAQAITDVFCELAQLLVRDGEGATKFVTVNVSGGNSTEDCLKVAYTVGESPLVKTALFASDANWGRLVMAIGRAGVAHLDSTTVKVWLDDVLIVEQGGAAESYHEALGSAVLSQPEFTIAIDLGMGDCTETIWTCDLSHEYVSINADYRS